MALVDAVAHCLSDGMVRNGMAGEAMILQQGPFFSDVFFRGGGLVDVEMIAPAREFEPIVAHCFCQRGKFLEWEIVPLASKERKRTRHGRQWLGIAASGKGIPVQRFGENGFELWYAEWLYQSMREAEIGRIGQNGIIRIATGGNGAYAGIKRQQVGKDFLAAEIAGDREIKDDDIEGMAGLLSSAIKANRFHTARGRTDLMA